MKPPAPAPPRIAFLGNHLPRPCGIATFTTDLCEAIAAATQPENCLVVALTDQDHAYDYPERVQFEIPDQQAQAYTRAADFLNHKEVDLLCLQHEFGIFGGPAGSHVLTFLRDVRMPVVTTLHTVLQNPTRLQQQVLEEIAGRSERLVVMSRRAADDLQTVYQVPPAKITFIPHGIPDIPFVDPNFYKDKFGVEGRPVLLTFGLLSPNKGIESVLQALPEILRHHPEVVYFVLGATHPQVLRAQGERYRDSLQALTRTLGVVEHVKFINDFVSLADLVEYIGVADIYVTPYLNADQSVSGTLAYTLGAGKAVVSTPYWYAQELLAEERGRLVPFADPERLAAQVRYLLDHETERHAMRKRAYCYGREMIWPEVAQRYLNCFAAAQAERSHQAHPLLVAHPWPGDMTANLPLLNLSHLRHMTDSTGLLQHAVHTVPNYSEGYSTDDNARALGVGVWLEALDEADWLGERRWLTARYLAFLSHAFNPATGRFRNFMGYNRNWREDAGSEDSHGRTLQNLGLLLGHSDQEDLRGVAMRLFEAALPQALALSHPRSWAFTLLGLHEYLRRFDGDRQAQQAVAQLTEKLMESYRAHATPDWPWFEDQLTYCNAALPQAVLAGSYRLERPDLKAVALESLRWLIQEQQSDRGHFAPIGCDGFYPRGEDKARFDQQPVEAHCLISACLEAWRLTGQVEWQHRAQWAFEWFLGRNDLGLPLYDPSSGGCYDGLHINGVNQNQGAESTLAFLLSVLELRQARQLLLPLRDAASRPERVQVELALVPIKQ